MGSSASRTSGFPATARATATRCCWPPESCEGKWWIRCSRPTRSSASCTIALRSAGGSPRYLSGSSTLRIHVEIADEIEGLEDEADGPAADPGPLRRRERGHRLAREHVAALAGRIEKAEESRAGWSCRSPTARRRRRTRRHGCRGSPARARASPPRRCGRSWRCRRGGSGDRSRGPCLFVPEGDHRVGPWLRVARAAPRRAPRRPRARPAPVAKVGGSVGLTW